MMELNQLLKEEHILLDLEADTREECIQKLIKAMSHTGGVVDENVYLEAVLKREEEGTTGVGFGVAIPHGKSKGVSSPGLAFAQLKQHVDWNSLDGNPVNIVFLIAVPEEEAGSAHLQILSSISRKLIHEEFRTKLNNAVSAEDVRRAIIG